MELQIKYKYVCSNCKKTVFEIGKAILSEGESASKLAEYLINLNIIKPDSPKIHNCRDSNSHGIYVESGILNLVGIVLDQDPAGTVEKKYPCIESTVEFPLDLADGVTKYFVRIWINEAHVDSNYSNRFIVEDLMYFIKTREDRYLEIDKAVIAEHTAKITGVNAVQVKDLNDPLEAGIILYPVDF